MNRYEVAITGLAAAVAGLVYLARQLVKVTRRIDALFAMPVQYRALAAVTVANTEAIAELTIAVAKLAQVERERGAR
ncbi:MAG TPA: hypothetical protein VIX86_19205 [Streptosporangiaceae bacterium]